MFTPLETRIVELLKSGLSLSEAEKEDGANTQIVRQVANDIGWDVSWRSSKYDKHKEKYDDIYNLYVNQGWTLLKVGKKYNCSRERVRQILADMNYRRRQLDKAQFSNPEIKKNIYECLLLGKSTVAELSSQFKIPLRVVQEIIDSLTEEQFFAYRAKYIEVQYYKTKKHYSQKMAIALDLWPMKTEDIAAAMSEKREKPINREGLNQLIIKCRKNYNWFAQKYGSKTKMVSESENISKLILKDKNSIRASKIRTAIKRLNKEIDGINGKLENLQKMLQEKSLTEPMVGSKSEIEKYEQNINMLNEKKSKIFNALEDLNSKSEQLQYDIYAMDQQQKLSANLYILELEKNHIQNQIEKRIEIIKRSTNTFNKHKQQNDKKSNNKTVESLEKYGKLLQENISKKEKLVKRLENKEQTINSIKVELITFEKNIVEQKR